MRYIRLRSFRTFTTFDLKPNEKIGFEESSAFYGNVRYSVETAQETGKMLKFAANFPSRTIIAKTAMR